MPTSRRRFLVGLGLIPMAACAPDPTIVGGPEALWSPEPTAPVLGEAADAASLLIAELIDGAQTIRAAAATWDPAGDLSQWADAVVRMCRLQLDRLLSIDPFLEPDPIFDYPARTEPDVGASDSDAETWLSATVARHVAALRDLALDGESQPERLLYTSLALSTAGVANQLSSPVAGSPVPIRFPEVSVESSQEVALSHCWALIRGLEVGIGRLDASDPLSTIGTERASSARILRNDLRARAATVPEQEIAYQMPTPMQSSAEIRQGWGILEERVLDSLARVFIASLDIDWFDLAITQVGYVQAMERPLNYWPGWVTT